GHGSDFVGLAAPFAGGDALDEPQAGGRGLRDQVAASAPPEDSFELAEHLVNRFPRDAGRDPNLDDRPQISPLDRLDVVVNVTLHEFSRAAAHRADLVRLRAVAAPVVAIGVLVVRRHEVAHGDHDAAFEFRPGDVGGFPSLDPRRVRAAGLWGVPRAEVMRLAVVVNVGAAAGFVVAHHGSFALAAAAYAGFLFHPLSTA